MQSPILVGQDIKLHKFSLIQAQQNRINKEKLGPYHTVNTWAVH